MAKFIYLYRGPATDMSAMSEDDTKVMLDQWAAWIGRVGGKMVDVGSPMANGDSVIDDGSEGKAPLLYGYSIVEAGDLDEAKTHTVGHPFLSAGTGEFSVDVYELLPLTV